MMITIQKPRLPPVLPFTSVERHIKHVTLALPQRGAHGFHKLDYGPWQLGDCYLSQADACWLLRVGSPKCVSLTYGGGELFRKILNQDIWILTISLFLVKVQLNPETFTFFLTAPCSARSKAGSLTSVRNVLLAAAGMRQARLPLFGFHALILS